MGDGSLGRWSEGEERLWRYVYTSESDSIEANRITRKFSDTGFTTTTIESVGRCF